jgi:hypothetical protein
LLPQAGNYKHCPNMTTMAPKEQKQTIQRDLPTADATPAAQVHQPFAQPATAGAGPSTHPGGEPPKDSNPKLPPPADQPTDKDTQPADKTPPPAVDPAQQNKEIGEISSSPSESSNNKSQHTPKPKSPAPGHHSGGEQHTSKDKHTQGGELKDQPQAKATPSQTITTEKDDVQIVVQMAKGVSTSSHHNSRAACTSCSRLETKMTAAKEAATAYIAAEAALETAKAEAAATGSSLMDKQAATTSFVAAQVQHKAADLAKKAAMHAEKSAAWTAQQAAAEAETTQVIADQLLSSRAPNPNHKPTPPPTFPKATPDSKHHPLGPNNPSIFVPIIPIPSPDKPLPGPLPYEDA